MLKRWEHGADRLDALEDIISLRASFLIDRLITGLSIDFDRALEILRRKNDFTSRYEELQRDTLVAGIENLVDFAASEEYTMMQELTEEFDDAFGDECFEVCSKYNGSRARQENSDVLYAAAMAGWWMTVSEDTVLTFMTQGDDRVRPWHSAYEGYSYPKSSFPPELIPPIEWGCRCYLESDGYASVHGSLPLQEAGLHVNPVFQESLATGGRISSSEHPYFRYPLPEKLKQTVKRLKDKLYGN